MRIRSPKDFWAGLIFVAIGAGFIALAQQYRLGDMHRMGPAMFPTLVGALLAVLGAAIVLRSFLLDGESVPRFHARPIGVSLLAIVLFGIALQWLGLVAAVAVLVLVGSYATRDVRPLENLALAAVMIVFSVAVFVWLLGLSLPLWPNS
jgi:putative tricarboxylic transport membrane protein